MKRILISLFLSLSAIFNTNAMCSDQAPVEYVNKQTRGNKTTYIALLKYNNEPEYQFKCKITYDSITNTYSGEYFNNGYSKPVWESTTISDQDAKRYYQMLITQER